MGSWKTLYYKTFLRPAYRALGLYRVHLKRPVFFEFADNRYRYFYAWPGMTYLNERCVEIPIILEHVRMAKGKRILEVGNVLSRYFDVDHVVVDKYEQGSDVINQDVVELAPSEPFDLIVSISTLEHVGFDEGPVDPKKPRRALENLVRCLAPGGELLFTFPLGYNPHIDALIRGSELDFVEARVLERISGYSNRWREASWKDAEDARYGYPFRSGNWIVVGSVRRA